MDYKIGWTEKSLKDFDLLDNSIKKTVMKFFDKKLEKAENPKVFGKQLTGALAGYMINVYYLTYLPIFNFAFCIN